jgi:taurine transport system permease protein
MTAIVATTGGARWRLSTRAWSARAAWAVLPFVGLIVVWQIVYALDVVPRVWLPSPAAAWSALVGVIRSGELASDTEASLGRLFAGYLVSVVMGISVGVIFGVKAGFASFVQPVVSFLNGMSGLVWIPLALLWFGTGDLAVTFVVWNSVFFLVLYNTITGVQGVPKIYESAMLTLGSSRWRIIRDVLIPGAMPNIVTGLRLGMGFGWRALIAAEIFAASDGLGHLIYISSYYFRTATIFAGLAVVGTIWLLTDRLLLIPLENWTVRRWGMIASER